MLFLIKAPSCIDFVKEDRVIAELLPLVMRY